MLFGALSSIALNIHAAEVKFHQDVEVLVVNGLDAAKYDKDYQLRDGYNQVVVQMVKKFGNKGSQDLFESKPYLVSFNASQDDIDVLPPRVSSKQHAENVFAGHPEWRVLAKGHEIDSKSAFLKGKGGFVPYWDMEELVEDYNIEHGISLSAKAVAVESTSRSATTAVNAKGMQKKDTKQKSARASDHPKALEQLQAWYLKASQEDRKAFRKWMVDQD